jgi:hypothetical protein
VTTSTLTLSVVTIFDGVNSLPANEIPEAARAVGSDPDADGDGIKDVADGAIVTGSPDSDGDGVIDQFDPDADNDGIKDEADANSRNALDTDGDNAIDAFETDLDGDGVLDTLDREVNNRVYPGKGRILDIFETDTDGDGKDDRIFLGDVLKNETIGNSQSVTIRADDLNVSAVTPGQVKSYAASGSKAGKLAIAGQVTINEMSRNTEAYLAAADVESATGVRVTATDLTSILTISGAVTFGGKVGISASVAVNTIDNSVKAYTLNTDIDAAGDLLVEAGSLGQIRTITAAAAVAATPGLQAAGSVSVNTITNETEACLKGKKTVGVESQTVTVAAMDTSGITADAGGFAIALARKKTGATGAGTIGVSVALNEVANSTDAYIEDHVGGMNVVATTGDIIVSATDAASIQADVIGASLAVSGSSKGVAGAVAIGLSVAKNEINNTILAYLENSTVDATAGNVAITAVEDATIWATSVAAAVSIAAGSKSGAVSLSGGGADAANVILGQMPPT